MSDDAKIARLHVVSAPTVEVEIRAALIEMLEQTLEEARRGEITEMFMILKHPGVNEWSDRATPTQNLTDWIGKIEVAKNAWIAHFNHTERKCHE